MKTKNDLAHVEAQYADALQLLTAHGYAATITKTFGGSLTIGVNPIAGRTVYIVDKSGPLRVEREDQTGWGIGFFNDYDDLIYYVDTKQKTAGALLDLLNEAIREGDFGTIDISDFDRAEVLAALYNASKPIGLGTLDTDGPGDMTIESARELLTPLEQSGDESDLYFEYLYGRPLKVLLSRDAFDPEDYDSRNGGPGTAKRVIDQLRDETKAGKRKKTA